ncbi:MAG: hypothetical protein R3C05_06355 [Pirellulaceae bacterium]
MNSITCLLLKKRAYWLEFSHLQTDPSDTPPIRARIASFCIGQCEDRVAAAMALMQASIDLSAGAGIREFEVGTVLGDLSGLVGLEPYSGVVGMLDSDRLVIDMLVTRGFERRSVMVAMEMNLGTFRAPVDRDLMLLRRMANLSEEPMHIPTDWRAACAHSHFDITQFTLTNRVGQELATAVYYLSDQDATVMDRGLLYLADFNSAVAHPLAEDLTPEIRYAVAGSLPVLSQRRFHTVRAIIDSSKPSAAARIAFLQGMGFQQVASGSAYHKSLS